MDDRQERGKGEASVKAPEKSHRCKAGELPSRRKSPAYSCLELYGAPRPQVAPGPQLFQFNNVATGDTFAISAIEENGQAWFDAAQVCRALGLSRPSFALRRLDDDEKDVRSKHTLGGEQKALFVNESGLYHLIFTSRTAGAVLFRKWITGTVIPAIRKHGGYINGMEGQGQESQRATLQVIHEEARRVGLNVAEEKEARASAFRLMRGRSR